MTKDRVRVLCVAENWRTKPMGRDAAERMIASGFPDCYGTEHRVIPADDNESESE